MAKVFNIGILAKANHPALKYAPNSLIISGIQIKFTNLSTEKSQKLDSLLVLPPISSEDLHLKWEENKNICWMHSFS